MPPAYHAVVAGLGGMGSAAACHLASRGLRVLGLERYAPAHDRGSSHGVSRIIRQAYFEGPEYVPLLLRAYELWEALERESGRDLLRITGGLMVGRRGGALLSGSLASAGAWDLPCELLDAPELRRRFPAFAPDDDTAALYERRAGFVRPEEAVRAHLELAASRGAELRFGEPALSWDALPGGEGVRVETPDGAYEAERLVLAPGAWAPEVLSDLGLPLVVTRQVMYWFEPASRPELFSPERFPVFVWEPDGGEVFYGIPDGHRGGVKAAFHHADGSPCTPETVVREVGEEEPERIRRCLRSHIPDLPGRLLEAKVCMYTNTPDGHFVISRHPRHPQVAIACGFSGHGFKFASVVGEILADLAAGGSTRHPIGLFSPERAR